MHYCPTRYAHEASSQYEEDPNDSFCQHYTCATLNNLQFLCFAIAVSGDLYDKTTKKSYFLLKERFLGGLSLIA